MYFAPDEPGVYAAFFLGYLLIGAAYMAGISAGVYDLEKLAGNMKRSVYEPKMDDEIREKKYAGWKKAVDGVLSK